MLSKKMAAFHEAVWAAVPDHGRSGPKIADALMNEFFPKSCRATEEEGVDRLFREMIVREINRLLSHEPSPTGQKDFAEIHPDFRDAVTALQKTAYMVPSQEEYVPVPTLIENPELLGEARDYLHQHGQWCIEEAARLDDLYKIVVATRE